MEGFEVVDGAEVVGEEEGGGVGLGEDVGQLVGAVAGVEGDDDDAEAGGGVLGDEPQRAIGKPDRQRVGAAQAEGGEAGGEGVDAPAEIGEGDALVTEDDGLAGGVALGHGGQHLVGGGLVERVRRHGYPGRIIIRRARSPAACS